MTEKQTCIYKEGSDGFTYTSCGQCTFLDTAQRKTYCPDCGKEIRREVMTK